MSLKNFLASYSVVFFRSILQNLKYLFLFVYSLQVTFKICVIPKSNKCLAFNPLTKLPKYNPGITSIA